MGCELIEGGLRSIRSSHTPRGNPVIACCVLFGIRGIRYFVESNEERAFFSDLGYLLLLQFKTYQGCVAPVAFADRCEVRAGEKRGHVVLLVALRSADPPFGKSLFVLHLMPGRQGAGHAILA